MDGEGYPERAGVRSKLETRDQQSAAGIARFQREGEREKQREASRKGWITRRQNAKGHQKDGMGENALVCMGVNIPAQTLFRLRQIAVLRQLQKISRSETRRRRQRKNFQGSVGEVIVEIVERNIHIYERQYGISTDPAWLRKVLG